MERNIYIMDHITKRFFNRCLRGILLESLSCLDNNCQKIELMKEES